MKSGCNRMKLQAATNRGEPPFSLIVNEAILTPQLPAIWRLGRKENSLLPLYPYTSAKSLADGKESSLCAGAGRCDGRYKLRIRRQPSPE